MRNMLKEALINKCDFLQDDMALAKAATMTSALKTEITYFTYN